MLAGQSDLTTAAVSCLQRCERVEGKRDFAVKEAGVRHLGDDVAVITPSQGRVQSLVPLSSGGGGGSKDGAGAAPTP